MRDEAGDRDDAAASARAGEAADGDDSPAAGDDSHSVADDERGPSSRPRESARPSELSDSEAGHRRWMAVAAACAVAAAVLLFTVGVNAAFVAAVLGVVAWFWDQRNHIRANIIEDEHSEEGRDELEEFDEDEGGHGAGRRRSDEV